MIGLVWDIKVPKTKNPSSLLAHPESLIPEPLIHESSSLGIAQSISLERFEDSEIQRSGIQRSGIQGSAMQDQ